MKRKAVFYLSKIKMKHIKKRYDDKNDYVIHDFNLNIEENEFIVFVGPSGCGKSTTLRMIAGLESITDGELWMDDKLVNDVEPKDRDIAMVFQNYALFPHYNVFDNIAFGLKMQKHKKQFIKKRVEAAAEILGLTDYLKRKPKDLSGGQRQRVALGRAIVRDAHIFLMDEPLSNLDAKLRIQMRKEIINLHRRLGTTTIYVTHDQTEAMTMASRIVVLNGGYIEQIGTPEEVYNTPATKFVAEFMGSPPMNFLEGSIKNNQLILHTGEVLGNLPTTFNDLEKVDIGIRAENLTVTEEKQGLMMTVNHVELMGADLHIHGVANGKEITVREDPKNKVNVNDTLFLKTNVENVHLFDVQSGKSLFEREKVEV